MRERVKLLRRYVDLADRRASVEDDIYDVLERLEKIRGTLGAEGADFAAIGDPLGLFSRYDENLKAAIGLAEDTILSVIDSRREPDPVTPEKVDPDFIKSVEKVVDTPVKEIVLAEASDDQLREKLDTEHFDDSIKGPHMPVREDVSELDALLNDPNQPVRVKIVAQLYKATMAGKKLTGAQVADLAGAKIGTTHAQLSLMSTTTQVVLRESVPAKGPGRRQTYGYWIAPGVSLREAIDGSK